nr:unnamed protein product [Callosobruchus chinensis]
MWTIMLTLAWLGNDMVSEAIPCEEARWKCAYRVGCGMALRNYLIGCDVVLRGPYPDKCPEICMHSLIALTSTEEGMDLTNCECSDEYCIDQKRRTEVCRAGVTHFMNQPVVSCSVAQWICGADALCSKALEYYNRYCRAMFAGKKCSARCNNSVNILHRQEKAARLFQCQCDGKEEYDCLAIQRNMNKLCFAKHTKHHNQTHPDESQLPKQDEVPSVVLANRSGVRVVLSPMVLLLALFIAIGRLGT